MPKVLREETHEVPQTRQRSCSFKQKTRTSTFTASCVTTRGRPCALSLGALAVPNVRIFFLIFLT